MATALGANSYGTVAKVAALTPRWTSSGSFGATTRPTEPQVANWVDEVSAILNACLAGAGFSIPITQADGLLFLANFVTVHVGALCDAANGAGAYVPGDNNNLRGRTAFEIIYKAACVFIATHADGLEKLGASRTYSMTDGLACRTTDESGGTIFPMFGRKQMGNQPINWDV